MLLSDDHRAVQEAVRQYVQAEIAPHAAAWDKSHQFPAAQLKGLAGLGCYGVAVPTEWDGAGLDYLALALIHQIGTSGGTGHGIEYFGPTVQALSMEARLTLCNMAVEFSAKYGFVPPDALTYDYLRGKAYAPQGAAWDAAATWTT